MTHVRYLHFRDFSRWRECFKLLMTLFCSRTEALLAAAAFSSAGTEVTDLRESPCPSSPASPLSSTGGRRPQKSCEIEPSELSDQEGLPCWSISVLLVSDFEGILFSLVLCGGPRSGDEVGSCQREDPAAQGRMLSAPLAETSECPKA